MSGQEELAEVFRQHGDDGCGDCICSDYILDGTLAQHMTDAVLAWLADRLADEGMREAVRDELSGFPIGSGYYQTQVAVDEARDMANAALDAVRERLIGATL